ncbi:three-Cys-motif partner protein TcmP [Mesorhizobium sp. CA16]|uniref:three-Cys-motif partner protein TcmP n=1 Tax=Mesorhizobium sp. CA16 TaxID=588496 RepID=UPI001CCC6B52|nr:three-Cys-motif partner protein TcmP [Mesorhizobium sp. CA16]MBZ9913755.1 three-Cys-motif partner protein TcmP [Mesorhizobium sp. CA16]
MGEQINLFSDLPDVSAPGMKLPALKTPVWTENKAKLIAKYLFYFVLITKHGAYIDGFAAPKQPEIEGSWAAKLVLESEPRFLRDFFFCEIEPERAKYLYELVANQPVTKPKRHTQVLVKDFNIAVADVLASGRITPKKATFCLIDQYSFECHWATLAALAGHKSLGNKIELFYFLGSGWLDRGLAGFTANLDVPERWWGRADWRSLVGMNGWSRALLFCDRFKEEFGYKHAHPWPIYERGSSGKVMFHMIHASDHDEAPLIMHRAYRNATKANEPLEATQASLLDLLAKLQTT